MKRFDQINVIPFIDIMLVLLAIVLTTATFISQGLIEVNLPAADSAAAMTEQHQSTEISIDASNRIYLDGDSVTIDALAADLDKIDKQTPIVFRVDKQTPFENFIDIIDLLKARKLEKFSIVTIEKQAQ